MHENETDGSIEDDEDDIDEFQNDLQNAIAESFGLVATKPGGKFMEVKNLGKAVRHLGCVPSEKELGEIENTVKNNKSPGMITIGVFVSHMEKQIRESRYRPATADELLTAFQRLDTENIGSLSKETMRQALRNGETFNDDEIDATLSTAYDPDYDCIHYDEWINKLLGKTKQDVYALVSNDDDTDGNEDGANQNA